MEEDYINIPLPVGEDVVEDYINLKERTPKRIQIVYELSKNIENIGTSSQEDS